MTPVREGKKKPRDIFEEEQQPEEHRASVYALINRHSPPF
jgi:hypothetical protein